MKLKSIKLEFLTGDPAWLAVRKTLGIHGANGLPWALKV
jgi:hypothetical protein